MKKSISKLGTIGAFLGLAAVTIIGQTGVQSRSITSDDFASQRPAKTDTGGKKAGSRQTQSPNLQIRSHR